MRQVELSQTEKRLEDAIEDVRQIVVGQVDGMEFVQLGKRLSWDWVYQIVRNVEHFETCHIMQRDL